MSGDWLDESAGASDTEAIGRHFAAKLRPNDVVGLIGPLGAGKTALVRGIVAGLGGDAAAVSSPTFALVHEYEARLRVFHFDTYRLPSAAAFAGLGLGEYFTAGGVCLIEWADRFPELLPPERWTVRIVPTDETRRFIHFEWIHG